MHTLFDMSLDRFILSKSFVPPEPISLLQSLNVIEDLLFNPLKQGTDHLIFRWGVAGIVLEKNSLFPYWRNKNTMSPMKLKVFDLHLAKFAVHNVRRNKRFFLKFNLLLSFILSYFNVLLSEKNLFQVILKNNLLCKKREKKLVVRKTVNGGSLCLFKTLK